MRLTDEQLNRMARAVLAEANRAFEDEPLATDWRQKYVDLRCVCHEQEAAIARWRGWARWWKRMFYAMSGLAVMALAVAVGAVGWWL